MTQQVGSMSGTASAARETEPAPGGASGTTEADPYEMAMAMGGHRKEDKFWAATLTALGQRLGVQAPEVETRGTCVDTKRQWRHARNVWHSSMIRSVLQTLKWTR
jgi:hypothetical protein